MRALLALTALCGCVESGSTFPVVSDECIADAVTYNRTAADAFRPPPPKPNAEPPLEVARELVEGRRTSGDTMVIPDDRTKDEMRSRGVVETTASFAFCLDTVGTVVSARRVSSSCFPRYDERIRKTILTWKYSPYSVDGVPKEVCTGVNFRYKIR